MMMKLIRFAVGLIAPAFIMAGSMTHSAIAQEASDLDDVRAANDAFYRALSARDLGVMWKVWSYKTEIRHISPRNKVINVGLDAAMRNWKGLFAAFPEFRITCEQEYIRVNGETAWVSVIEKAQWKNDDGETETATHFGTNIFEKQDGRWFMVYHHGSAVPQ
jgi:ketosteroid isomerase-like protein